MHPRRCPSSLEPKRRDGSGGPSSMPLALQPPDVLHSEAQVATRGSRSG